MYKTLGRFLKIQTFSVLITGLLLLMVGCAGGSGQQEDAGRTYQDNVKSMVEIQTVDRQGYDCLLYTSDAADE